VRDSIFRGSGCSGCDERDIELFTLRAILAPLLTEPERIAPSDAGKECLFCRVVQEWWPDPFEHEPDCPVLRRDELLGRSPG
jgi:hypothetical protein